MRRTRVVRWWNAALAAALLVVAAGQARAYTLTVEGPNGEAVTGFRWLVEEDVTYAVDPSVPTPDPASVLGINLHKSYMPVVTKGHEPGSAATIDLDPAKRYFISVLPDSGYSIGGVAVKPGDTAGTAVVNQHPIPTAQIKILVFEDNHPLNNAPDVPPERGLPGFKILLEDAGGRYGASAGHQIMDAFGNPLGTTYQRDAAGNYILVGGQPVVETLGTGLILTDANGEALIKNLAPGKYGISVVPPAGEGWQQVTTIEGTKVIDAWVKANEPPFLVEFAAPGPHVFVGFVKAFTDTAALTGTSSISGRVVQARFSRPPNQQISAGLPFNYTTPWIGLNQGANGPALYAGPASADGTFTIPNVPPGNYQLVVWDNNLDLIIQQVAVTVPADGSPVQLGDVPVIPWFTHLDNYVFEDRDEDGFRDPGELGVAEQAINLRFRDGSLYQSMPTDSEGFAPLDQVFPFFRWLVAEVDYLRFKATGVTVTVDDDGPIPAGLTLTPQPQLCTQADVDAGICAAVGDPKVNPNTGDNLSYTLSTAQEGAPPLLLGFQGFVGQRPILEWGKKPYGHNENGGISGVVYYAITRAENDPRFGVAEPWEPGVPRVPVVLYQDADFDGVIDDLDGDGGPTAPDVDFYPFGNFPGPEDTDRDGDGVFDYGDAIQITTTDSWDDSLPTGCQGDDFTLRGFDPDCYDGLRNWAQIRPAVFDGGWAFDSYYPGGMASHVDPTTGVLDTAAETAGLPSNMYIVEIVPPAGYEIVKEEDKNVDFGDEYVPSQLLMPPACVGDLHTVPAELSLFPGVPAAFAGQDRPLCNRKQIWLGEGMNAAADFFVFTEVPIAAHIVGTSLNDLANTFDPNNPAFGEKAAAAHIPVSIRDFTGREINRVYTDEFGNFNALVPSTFTANLPQPSGMSPNVLIACMNDPGPIPDPVTGQMVVDPYYNPKFAHVCYNLQFMPGTTTYLDTPVVPAAAFASTERYPLDCELPDGTPKIASVTGQDDTGAPVQGPYVPLTGGTVTITSEGTAVTVPNPAYDGPGGLNPATITRDYGFGSTPGTVTVGGTPLTIVSWTPDEIVATVPTDPVTGQATVSTGQLLVTRADNGLSSVVGITLHVGNPDGAVLTLNPGETIQDAIDRANPGDLILVPPGTYEEMVILYKPVKLQGAGAGSTVIRASRFPTEKIAVWQQKVADILAAGQADLLPAQQGALGPTEEGAGILVLGRQGVFSAATPAWIDGFQITGANIGGGVLVNGYAPYTRISNNRIAANRGAYAGGIRVGHPFLIETVPGGGQRYQSAYSDHVTIDHNHITGNGGNDGAGGGISLCTGADAYQVVGNYICGNFTSGHGAGIGHLGLSPGGEIRENVISFNQSFNQGLSRNGGGLYIAGAPPLGGQLSPGSGDVTVQGNRIQGNNAGSGDGAGIALERVNGQDVEAAPNTPSAWYRVTITQNVIVNNVTGRAGAGVSLQDALAEITQNTIAHNDSTASTGDVVDPADPGKTLPQPAGVVSRAHSPGLAGAFGADPAADPYREYSNPVLDSNIIWQNRQFYVQIDMTKPVGQQVRLMPDVDAGGVPPYADLAVLGTAAPAQLRPTNCVLTDTTGFDPADGNTMADPGFVEPYFNGNPNKNDPANHPLSEASSMIIAAALDEGGNFYDVLYGPLTVVGDYTAAGAGVGALSTEAFRMLSLAEPSTASAATSRDTARSEGGGGGSCFLQTLVGP